MGKSSRRRASAARSDAAAPLDGGDLPVVGQREPCPCGSGRKYKACHGRPRAVGTGHHVPRPFAGLTGEVDWVAMREVVPAATAVVRLRADVDLPTSGPLPPEVTVATVLPMAWPAMRRADGSVFVGLQNAAGSSGDPSRDVGAALALATAAEPGTPVMTVQPAADAPRLQDLLDAETTFEVTVHPGFDFWVEGTGDLSPEVQQSLERANASVVPTTRLTSVDGAYWAQVGDRVHLRWVLPQDEDRLLDAIARLHAAGRSGLGEGTRYIGAFRTHGLLVPVWDLARDATADDTEVPAHAFAERLDEALQVTTPLSYDERRARAGVVSRQLTLR